MKSYFLFLLVFVLSGCASNTPNKQIFEYQKPEIAFIGSSEEIPESPEIDLKTLNKVVTLEFDNVTFREAVLKLYSVSRKPNLMVCFHQIDEEAVYLIYSDEFRINLPKSTLTVGEFYGYISALVPFEMKVKERYVSWQLFFD